MEPALGSGLAQTGDSLCLPIRLLSSVGLTNLSFRVNYDPARLTNLFVHSLLPGACSASLTSVDPSNALIRLTVLGPQPFRGTQQLAEVCFTLCPGRQSAFLPLQITATQARQTDGSTVVNLVNTPGRLTVIGEEPLLELVINTNGHPTLVLYGKPAWNCDVNESPRLDAVTPWQLYRQTTLDDVFQTFDVTPQRTPCASSGP